jgi:hypothetical protein
MHPCFAGVIFIVNQYEMPSRRFEVELNEISSMRNELVVNR